MDSPFLYLAVLAAMGITSALMLRTSAALQSMATAASGRYRSLDGLRGLLALSVLTHHAYIAHRYFLHGEWVTPASNAYHFAGRGAVALFFMITGLLFWRKAIDGDLKLSSLMRLRIRRIMPLYLFSCVLIFAVCAVESGYRLQVEPARFALSIGRWLFGGLLGDPAINGINMPPVNGGVTWSLQYEWVFYLLLPLLALMAPLRRFPWLVLLYLALLPMGRLLGFDRASSVMLQVFPFIGGMLAAYLTHGTRPVPAALSWIASCFVVASIAVVAALYDVNLGTKLAWALVPAFVLIALGNDVFGLLSLRWLRWLGHISFSVYLLHGIVLMTCLKLLNVRWPIANWDASLYIGVCAAVGVLVVLLSSATYLLIERRFIAAPVRAPSLAAAAA